MSEGAREDPELSAASESSGEIHLSLDDAIANGEKVRGRRLRNISSFGGLDLMVEDSDMESEDVQPMAYEDDCAEEGDDSSADDETGLLKRCSKILSDIYALGLEAEIEGEHINVILRELIDEIDAAVAASPEEDCQC